MDKQLPVSVWPEWKITEKIGEGSFGKVYKACRSEQGTTFYSAIKVITIPSNPGELSSVRSESPNEQSVKEYFQGLVDECIQEVSIPSKVRFIGEPFVFPETVVMAYGSVGTCYLEAEATVPAAVEQDVRIMDNVLRFLCVRKDEA